VFFFSVSQFSVLPVVTISLVFSHLPFVLELYSIPFNSLCQGPPSSPPHQTMDQQESDVPPNHIHSHPALEFYTATLGGARALHLSH